MAQGNIIQGPVMDWSEDEDLHKRFKDWRDEVELLVTATTSWYIQDCKSELCASCGQARLRRVYLKSEGTATTAHETILHSPGRLDKAKVQWDSILHKTTHSNSRLQESLRVHSRSQNSGWSLWIHRRQRQTAQRYHSLRSEVCMRIPKVHC